MFRTMKQTLPFLSAALLVCGIAVADPGPRPAPTAPAQKAAASAEAATPSAPHVTRWEEAGMTPVEAREWKTYSFQPQEAMDWKAAGFAPLVARTWSDKGFDPDEARAWVESTRQNRTLMAELDQTDPAAWKREGFSPTDRLAWWEAGFVFEDAVLLSRAGMSPAEAAWHGQEKLKELKEKSPTNVAGAAAPPVTGSPDSAPAAGLTLSLPDPARLWALTWPYLKIAMASMVGMMVALIVFVYVRNRRLNRVHRSALEAAPDSELPPSPQPPAAAAVAESEGVYTTKSKHRRPARKFTLTRGQPTCVHCQSTHVRPSRMNPHRFLGVNFTEYYRCRNCGRHFALVTYTPILLIAGSILLAVTMVTASVIYGLSLIPGSP